MQSEYFIWNTLYYTTESPAYQLFNLNTDNDWGNSSKIFFSLGLNVEANYQGQG